MNSKAMVIAGALAALVSTGAAADAAFAQPTREDSLGAGWREQQNEAQRGVREGRYVSLAQVIQTIRRRTPGRQLDAGLEAGPGGRAVYRVRWAADDGRRVDYLVDAESGQIISGD